jgi:hypothetical protein
MFYFFKFIYVIISKTLYILFYRRKETQWGKQFLQKIQDENGEKLDDFTFNKIVNSYAIFNTIICDAFSLLYGRTTNRNEKIRMLHYFICSSLMDNFIDWNLLSDDSLNRISFQPEEYVPETLSEKMFLQSHLVLKNFVQDLDSYIEITRKMFTAQKDSLLQFDEHIAEKELKRITFEKGGYSLLLCSFYFDRVTSDVEKNCWYKLGAIIQLTNDLYDIYKDLQESSFTLATKMQDAYFFQKYFEALIKDFKEEISKVIRDKKNILQFSVAMAGIYGLGLVAIEQLQRKQKDKNALLNLKPLSRKDLIVDMEKPSNFFRCVSLVYKYGKL